MTRTRTSGTPLPAQGPAPRRNKEKKKEKKKEEKKKKKDDISSSSSSKEEDFQPSRASGHGVSPALRKAHRSPGKLLGETLEKMGTYLSTVQGAGSGDGLHPIVMSYLTAVLTPSVGSELSIRNSRELRTLAMALDFLIQGDVPQACDVLVQRFKAVEITQADGSWAHARHMELIPEARVTSTSQAERASILQQEKDELKMRANLAAAAKAKAGNY